MGRLPSDRLDKKPLSSAALVSSPSQSTTVNKKARLVAALIATTALAFGCAAAWRANGGKVLSPTYNPRYNNPPLLRAADISSESLKSATVDPKQTLSNSSVTVNGQEINVPANGTIHQELSSDKSNTKPDITSKQFTQADRSRSSITVNSFSSTTTVSRNN